LKVVIDIETNSLTKPTKIWCVVCKSIDTGQISIFRNLTEDTKEKESFLEFSKEVNTWVGHNILGYDIPHLSNLILFDATDISSHSLDTFILSKLINYSRSDGHSIEAYGNQFGLEKIKFNDFTKWSQELEDYCVRDVEICHKIYNHYNNIHSNPRWANSINLEQSFQLICNDLNRVGFSFNDDKASKLLVKINKELEDLDVQILRAFPPREKIIKEFTPKATKFGTISKTSIPRSLWGNILNYELGKTYSHSRLEEFNPASHKQIITILSEAGWRPVDKTTTHIDTLRELQRLKYSREENKQVDIKVLSDKLLVLEKFGYKINENNLSTLPDTAPSSARLLAKRILLESRRRTLTEWLGLVSSDDGRIHGKFQGIGAWTHRMAHQQPNTANIPREFKEDGTPKLLGREMRELWKAPKNRLLVGVDAEGIQLRIFAHYINDPEFTKALVEGKKEDKSDPHSLNQRILGPSCKTRQAAKRFVYALLLGGGISKLAQVLEASRDETESALARLMERYQGWADLKKNIIPVDARRGWFRGLDGRSVRIPGDTPSERRHLCMSGYLQNGEALAIKTAAIKIYNDLKEKRELKDWFFVNIVHDELQSEVKNDLSFALKIAQIKADAIKFAGEELGLRCPLAGSYWNDDNKDYTIGTNWFKTH